MKQLTLQHGIALTLAMLASAQTSEGQALQRAGGIVTSGGISGIIRDADGVPQMGALVQAILPDSTLGGSAVTDSRGRYHFYLPPGRYRLLATAALFYPAVREHLQVARGTRAVVDMTLATLLAPSGWLPATRRTSSEPSDDWMWTLRSSSSRPILRLNNPRPRVADDTSSSEDAATITAENGDGSLVISSSAQESRRGASGGRVTLKSSDGSFGRGGNHTILVLSRANEDGSGGVLRADFSGPRTPYPVNPSSEISVGLQRRTPLNGFNRALLTYSNHPELTDGHGHTGMQGATLRTAQRIDVGDSVRIDAGSVAREVNLAGNALIVEPFLRISARPGGSVVLAYSMTRSRGTESLDDLDRVQAVTPVAILRKGHMRFETGTHQSLSASGKVRGGGTVEVALYTEGFNNPQVSGIGTLATADLQGTDLIADPTTATYRVAVRDYRSSGVRVAFAQPITHSLRAGASFVTGEALKAPLAASASMADLVNGLDPGRIYAGSVFVDGKILHTGTTLRASYRWQPLRALTAVDAYRVGDDAAYLSCTLRQSLRGIPLMPQGLEAIVDLQNLLADGYQPFVSNDGQTLFLAQTPRAVQAGLSFSF